MPSDWQNQTITVLGLSKSGAAVARYVQKRGGRVFLSEYQPASPATEALRDELTGLGVQVETGGHSMTCFTHSDLVVASPGIPPSSAILEQLALSRKEIISEVEFAYRESEAPFIGITGTNGKSTTTSLISAILTESGLNAPACGNIGVPVAGVVDEGKADILVVELSSFQLALSPSLKTRIAVFTNFHPNHLDWHGSVEAYKQAKLRLFTGEQSPEWAVLNADDPVSQEVADRTVARCLWFSLDPGTVAPYPHKAYLDHDDRVVVERDGEQTSYFPVSDLRLIGRHNYENALMAVSVANLMEIPANVTTQACLSFQGLPHRLEFVATVNGAAFYNDSKATTPDAAISALRAFPGQPVILIAGGYDKNTPLAELARAARDHAGAVILLGPAADRFEQVLREAGVSAIHRAADLEASVTLGYQLSNGQPVLLSPACASFDRYRDFMERGLAFKDAVLSLKAKTTEKAEA